MPPKVNTFVTTNAISRAEKVTISKLKVVTNAGSSRGKRTYSRTNSSIAWKYFGALYAELADSRQPSTEIDADRMYCR